MDFTYLINQNIYLKKRRRFVTKIRLDRYQTLNLTRDQIPICLDTWKTLQILLNKKQLSWTQVKVVKELLYSWLSLQVELSTKHKLPMLMVGITLRIWNIAVTKWVLDWEQVASNLLKKTQLLIHNCQIWSMLRWIIWNNRCRWVLVQISFLARIQEWVIILQACNQVVGGRYQL